MYRSAALDGGEWSVSHCTTPGCWKTVLSHLRHLHSHYFDVLDARKLESRKVGWCSILFTLHVVKIRHICSKILRATIKDTPTVGSMWYHNRSLSWYRAKTKRHGLSLRANYTDRATAACRRSDCQLLRIEGATWSLWPYCRFSRPEPLLFDQVAPQLYSQGGVDPLLFFFW
jgi:hypothetical protein